MAGLEIEPEAMRKSADDLDAAKEEVQALLDQFTSAIEQYADAFGGDTIGSLAAPAHDECVSRATECFTSNIEALDAYSKDIREMADEHQAADDEVAKSFQEFLSVLEP